ncbi:MAG: aminoacyl-histidine dipeptidase [Bacteroidales bacterium]
MTTDKVLEIFKEITKIPRESGNEQHIIKYLVDFAKKRNLEVKKDKVGNVLITVAASKGYENAPTVILQSHSDMVCEKNEGVEHDFTKDPIKYIIKDGWMIAPDTTLGADCGIGIAAELALCDDKELSHPKIECLFTSSEETGMDGAFGISNDFISGKILINLDSEDEGELFIGCAGGINTIGNFDYIPTKCRFHNYYKIGFKGGVGGHSGDDINKEHCNANQQLARSLFRIMQKHDIDICIIDGGNKDNAISREAYAIISFISSNADDIKNIHIETAKAIKKEFANTDPNVTPIWEQTNYKGNVIEPTVAKKLIFCLNSIPHGVLGMSTDIDGLVETSTNLAAIKMEGENSVRILTSQRSSVDSERQYASETIECAFRAADARAIHNAEYPGWKPKMDSPILKTSIKAYKELFNKEPIVRAIHAGLECGLFLTKYPDLDMISFGPTLKGVHAPGEKLELATVEKFVKLLENIIIKIK